MVSFSNAAEALPLILEKAYAKIHLSYENIEGGRPEQALVDLTNGVPEVISFKSKEFGKMKNDGSFWQKIMQASNEGHLMCASSNQASDTFQNELGIVEGHAYSILDVQEVSVYLTSMQCLCRLTTINSSNCTILGGRKSGSGTGAMTTRSIGTKNDST